ncbi:MULTISPECIES: M24 family metallopeptidase [unclassified Beijerinckia]|uniref:M24 family metallopeptidase n=1 Tax=unclassified Beijerinckia TaxID=2638183 RepID=UPI0008959B81|nr:MULTISPECIES: M24 family metallopeptidase [unclassified Beijerinckia]MDH7798849.1 Xaa-Pro dipeptidase [Beijerinckia sp. GAS462]SED89066.1 Xaa-Pro aminopeptidase [Beijerinckia sp. 28-YEA-48]
MNVIVSNDRALELEKEREYRWSRTRAFMEKRGLDALLIFGSDRSDRYDAGQYLTYDRRYQQLIFPHKGDPTMIAFAAQVATQSMVEKERGNASWISDIRTGYVPELAPQILAENGLNRGRLGVIGAGWGGPFFRNGWVPKQLWESVEAALPGWEMVTVTQDFGALMAVRSPFDRENLARAAAAGDAAIEAMMAVARPGATETEIYTAGITEQVRRGMRVTWMLFQTGFENAAWGEPAWLIRGNPARRLERDDIVGGEIFPNFAELNTHVNMSFTIGKIPDQTRRCAEIAREAYEIGLAKLRPGASFRDIYEAMEVPTTKAGAWHLTPQIAALNPLSGGGPSAMGIREMLPDLAKAYPHVDGGELMPFDFEIKEGMTFSLQTDARLGHYWSNLGGLVIAEGKGVRELNRVSPHMGRVS